MEVITPTNHISSMSNTSKKVNHSEFIQQVKQRAYFIYNERVKQNLPGDELHDWLKAETEVKNNFSHS